jgi:hypothetical protein
MLKSMSLECRRVETALVLVLAAVPAIVALAVYGIIHQPDTAGYLAYATQIRTATVPAGSTLLHEGPMPLSLFRAPGYPAFLAGLQTLFPKCWAEVSVALQIGLSALVAAGAYRVALRLGAARHLAAAAALLPAVGFSVVLQISLLTDSLNAVFFTSAAMVLAAVDGVSAALAAGMLLALATSFREATPVLALWFLPLAWWCGKRRWLRMAAVILPPLCLAIALMTWNYVRINRPVVTTTAEVNMIQPLFPLIRRHLPVFPDADAVDRAAHETLTRPDFHQILQLLQRLFDQEGMTAPDLATAATVRYWRAWRQFPLAMLVASARRFRTSFLKMPFEPVDTVADLNVYSGQRLSPNIVKINVLWRQALAGDITSADPGRCYADIWYRCGGGRYRGALAARSKLERTWALDYLCRSACDLHARTP